MRSNIISIRKVLIILLLCFTSACAEKNSETVSLNLNSPEKTNTLANDADSIVAKVGKHSITLRELDANLKLELYDLQLAQYEIRLGKLSTLIKQIPLDNARPPELLLPIPQPPRINLPQRAQRIKGNPAAPIPITIFCSYQSSHCQAIQPALRKIAETYPGWTNQTIYDFPLKFHKQGFSAARAARCAEEQNALWPYQDGLYAYANKLGNNIYERLATQIELNLEDFRHCLTTKNFISDIKSDIKIGTDLGMKNVPVVFINGLYIKGPQAFDYYSLWIEKELRRLKIPLGAKHQWIASNTPQKLLHTKLPLALVGISLSSHTDKSTALIKVNKAAAKSFVVGSELLEGVILKKINQSSVHIDNRGLLQNLALSGENTVHVPLTGEYTRDAETLRRIEQPEGIGSKKLIAPSGILPLGQKWLEKHLENQVALQEKFTGSAWIVEGHQMMYLENIEDNDFFKGLGLIEGDALLRVNDTWVHSEQNQLWDALTSGEIVDVFFMRKGLPQRLQYRVEE